MVRTVPGAGDDWRPAEANAVGALGRSLRGRRARRRFLQGAAASAAAALLGAVGWQVSQRARGGERAVARITCEQARHYADLGAARKLAEPQRVELRQHLAHCHECRARGFGAKAGVG